MRKPNHTGPNSGKAKAFKRKEGDSSFKKSSPGSRPYKDKARGDGESFTGRKPKPRSFEDKPARSSERTGERSFAKKGPREDRPAPRERTSSDRKTKPRSFDDKPRRSFDRSDDRPSARREPRTDGTSSERRPRSFDDKPARSADRTGERSFAKKGAREDRPAQRERTPSDRKTKPRSFDDKPRRSFDGADDRTSFRKEPRAERTEGKPDYSKDKASRKSPGRPFDSNARKYGSDRKLDDKITTERNSRKKENAEDEAIKRVKFDDFEDGKVFSNTDKKTALKDKDKKKFKKPSAPSKPQAGDGLVRLNKYLSNAGVASRRDADTLIQSGVVKVNGVVVDQLGYKINPTDKVTYGDAPVRGERKVYLLLNKPKDYITTVDDPQERKTVMELVSKACKERIYPVGRLDRNTTGLLLFTNDGELTTKLTHPKFGVKKVYHVSLNKGLKPDDFKAITEGLELEDGIVKADDLAFVGEGKKEIGIEIHSGRNRIVRRIFEHLGYDVLKLDRVVFAGLTKKDLPRGKHRFLTAKEIGFLQMVG